MKVKLFAVLLLSAGMVTLAHADINVGVLVCATGPAASLGIPEKNTFALLPTTIAGEKVNYIILDDASDPTTAVKNAHKLVSEDKVDILMGSSITPNSLAMIDVAAESETPMISMAAGTAIVTPMDAKRHWVFKTAQNDQQMSSAIVEHMNATGVKTVAFIGYNDAYGDGWWREFSKAAEATKLKIVAGERFSRTDTSVTGQVLKVMATNPDAILIAGSGTPAALPQRTLVEKGYKGKIYQTHGAANNDFLRVCGKDCEGTFMPAGPILVAAQLPDSNLVKKSSLEYINKYEKEHGPGSVAPFGGYAWDAGLLFANAAPKALKKAKPGTKEFRAALRDAVEETKELYASQSVFNMTPADHLGLDDRARVMVRIEGGKWVLEK